VDFVVVGFGLGALAVLLGLLLRDIGPRRLRVRPGLVLAASEVVRRVAWGRGCRAAGRTLALAGAALWLVPVVALVAGLSDRIGAILVLAVLVLATGGVGAWAVAYAHRYHPRPVRRRPAGRATPPRGTVAPSAFDSSDAGTGAFFAVGLAPAELPPMRADGDEGGSVDPAEPTGPGDEAAPIAAESDPPDADSTTAEDAADAAQATPNETSPLGGALGEPSGAETVATPEAAASEESPAGEPPGKVAEAADLLLPVGRSS
jgi:hypothetical protein